MFSFFQRPPDPLDPQPFHRSFGRYYGKACILSHSSPEPKGEYFSRDELRLRSVMAKGASGNSGPAPVLVEFAFLSWLPMTGHDIVSIIEAQRMHRSNRWPDSFFSPIIADTRPSIF